MAVDAQLVSSVISQAAERRGELVALVQKLVRIPSLSGEEDQVARVYAAALQDLGYDQVRIDATGNVIAVIKGVGHEPVFVLNGHLDHVPPQGMVEPYSGDVLDGHEFGSDGPVIYGRGTCDMKGALGAMAIAGALIRDSGRRLRGDFVVTACVREEIGGDGTRALLSDGLRPDYAVVCEPSGLKLALGQRGYINIGVLVGGQSCHASMPEQGHNALYRAARLVTAIEKRLPGRLPAHPLFGPVSVAVTNLTVHPGVANMVPGECGITVNVRNHPLFLADQVLGSILDLIAEEKAQDAELVAHVFYLRSDQQPFSGFYMAPETPIVQAATEAIRIVTGADPEFVVWRFGSDARIFFGSGIPVCGLGPGDPHLAHSQREYVSVADLVLAAQIYAMYGLRVCS